MKKITIIAPGSRGDVEPYLALGQGLIKAGNLVRLVTHENFEALVNSHRLDFYPVEGDAQDIAESMAQILESGNFISILLRMSKEAQDGSLRLAKAALEASQGTDLILAGIGGLFVGAAVAEKLSIPLLQAYYIPFTPTSEYPSFLFPRLPLKTGRFVNRLSFSLVQQMMWQPFRSADRTARREVLSIPPAPFRGPYQSECMRNQPILYGFSPSVIPPPPDWNQQTHVTGYWFPEHPQSWTPSPALEEFLQAGLPPVFIGFGSMSNQKPEEMTDLVLKALQQSGQRGILLTGWGGMQSSNLPDTVFQIDQIPFTWLFPRMAAVVHHGGAGTTGIGLSAGIPSVIIPYFGDQPYWGQRVFELGVGPAPIPRKKLTSELLAKAIKIAVSDEEMRRRAADLGAKIQAEDGVAQGVQIIQNC